MNTQVISGAGHHIFADKPDVFNDYVNSACRFSDKLPDDETGEMTIFNCFFFSVFFFFIVVVIEFAIELIIIGYWKLFC